MRFPATVIAITMVLGVIGCVGEAERAERGQAPLVGKSDGSDSADNNCNIVLRQVARVPGSGGGYESVCVAGQCWFVWQGSLDISAAAVSEMATPKVTYQSGSDASWWLVETTPAPGAAEGYQRYSFRFFEHTVNPGMSLTSLMQTRIQVAPYLRTSSGGRVFDHNRNPGAFDNYLLTSDNNWSIDNDTTVCSGVQAVPVKLSSAQVFTQFGYPAITHTTLKGIVRAGDGSSDESMSVHYRISEGANIVRDWSVVDAQKVTPGVWEFVTPVFDSSCPHYCPRHVYQFAIGHTADGVTEWDNNGGAGVDYVLADDVGGSVPGYYGPVGIIDTPVQLSYLDWQGGTSSGVARGEILIKNIAYHKDVRVVYSTDDWATTLEAAAYFRRVTFDELEYWQFSVQFNEKPANFQLGVRYQVDGQTYLDTNLERYYRLP